MSIDGLGPVPTAAGAPMAQAHGAELARAQAESAARARESQSQAQLDRASGVGQTDGEELTTDQRDADGRMPWQAPPGNEPQAESPAKPTDPASGDSGRLLDLIG